jgi:hypothetical protein
MSNISHFCKFIFKNALLPSQRNYFAFTSEMNVINKKKNADVSSSHIFKSQ